MIVNLGYTVRHPGNTIIKNNDDDDTKVWKFALYVKMLKKELSNALTCGVKFLRLQIPTFCLTKEEQQELFKIPEVCKYKGLLEKFDMKFCLHAYYTYFSLKTDCSRMVDYFSSLNDFIDFLGAPDCTIETHLVDNLPLSDICVSTLTKLCSDERFKKRIVFENTPYHCSVEDCHSFYKEFNLNYIIDNSHEVIRLGNASNVFALGKEAKYFHYSSIVDENYHGEIDYNDFIKFIKKLKDTGKSETYVLLEVPGIRNAKVELRTQTLEYLTWFSDFKIGVV